MSFHACAEMLLRQENFSDATIRNVLSQDDEFICRLTGLPKPIKKSIKNKCTETPICISLCSSNGKGIIFNEKSIQNITDDTDIPDLPHKICVSFSYGLPNTVIAVLMTSKCWTRKHLLKTILSKYKELLSNRSIDHSILSDIVVHQLLYKKTKKAYYYMDFDLR